LTDEWLNEDNENDSYKKIKKKRKKREKKKANAQSPSPQVLSSQNLRPEREITILDQQAKCNEASKREEEIKI